MNLLGTLKDLLPGVLGGKNLARTLFKIASRLGASQIGDEGAILLNRMSAEGRAQLAGRCEALALDLRANKLDDAGHVIALAIGDFRL